MAAEIVALGGSAVVAPTDVSQPEACEALVARAIDEFGALHIVVNNGHHQGDFTHLEDSDVSTWGAIMQVNLYGPMRIIQAAAPHMKRQGDGRIVNVNSGAVISSKPGLSVLGVEGRAREHHEDARPRARTFGDPGQRCVRELDGR